MLGYAAKCVMAFEAGSEKETYTSVEVLKVMNAGKVEQQTVSRASRQGVVPSLSIALILSICAVASVSAQDTKQIDQAVSVVESLCLSGTEYGLDADIEGNIRIKSFKPNAGGSVTLNVREAVGATAFQDDLRIIADEDVRECTQQHIGRILDAVLASTPPESTPKIENVSFTSARYLGYVPEAVSVRGALDGEETLYYRFSVKEPSEVTISMSRLSKRLDVELLSPKRSKIAYASFSNFGSMREQFLMPGDYYITLKIRERSKSATAFELEVQGLADI